MPTNVEKLILIYENHDRIEIPIQHVHQCAYRDLQEIDLDETGNFIIYVALEFKLTLKSSIHRAHIRLTNSLISDDIVDKRPIGPILINRKDLALIYIQKSDDKQVDTIHVDWDENSSYGDNSYQTNHTDNQNNIYIEVVSPTYKNNTTK